MKIAVCVKQVPGSTEVMMDCEKGVLIRDGADVKTNPYDLSAVEAALQVREMLSGSVTAFSMGPPSATQVIKDCFAMGVDDGCLITDRRFAGADVQATSYTLAQAVKSIGEYGLIICGRQTTDGDTGQVGPSIAEHMGIIHVCWITSIDYVDNEEIVVTQCLTDMMVQVRVKYPCLLVVDKDTFKPRMPSLRLKLNSKNKEVKILSIDDMLDNNPLKYGLNGSPTQVEKIFPPKRTKKREILIGDSIQLTKFLTDAIQKHKII